MLFQRFESVIIVDGLLSEDAANAVANKFLKIMEDWSLPVAQHLKAKDVAIVERMGKKKLAYEIKKRTEGWYFVFTFWSKPENIATLDKMYRITDEVLKFINLKKETDGTDALDLLEEEIDPEAGDDQDKVNSCEYAKPKTPLGQNHYDYLFGYTDELKG